VVSLAKSNVILMMTDDQGYGDLGYHGNEILKTPELDRFKPSPTAVSPLWRYQCLASMCSRIGSGSKWKLNNQQSVF
jgi:hypothetical protein